LKGSKHEPGFQVRKNRSEVYERTGRTRERERKEREREEERKREREKKREKKGRERERDKQRRNSPAKTQDTATHPALPRTLAA